MLTLELVVEQNTKMVERLDRSMAQLTQAMADLRVEMRKGFSDLRQEMAHGQAELRKEMAVDHEKLQNKIDKNFFLAVIFEYHYPSWHFECVG